MAQVVLINPPITGKRPSLLIPGLGLGYLASALRSAGLTVKIIDAPALGMGFDQTVNEVLTQKPAVAGITCTTPLSDSAYELGRRLKGQVQFLVMGGAHASAVGGRIFEECPEFDFAFLGEAEEGFPALVKKILAGEKTPEVPGVIWRGHGSAPVKIASLDHLAFPAWDLMPMQKYRHPLFPGERVATMISSRGCPYQCVFCDKSVCGSKFRPRSPDNVLAEVWELHDKQGVRAIIFYDDLFTLDSDRVVEICRRMVEAKLKIAWKCEGRVNLVDPETLSWMKKAGCRMIAYGIESGRQESLDWLNKGVKVRQVEEAVRLTRAAGIKTLGYFIFGIPGETCEQELESVEFAIRLQLDYVQFASLSPFPGSRLYDLALENGWYKDGKGPGPEEYGERRPLLLTDYWTEDRLKKILQDGYRKFYFRPGYILREAMNPRGFLDLVRSGFRLTRWLEKE
jgi:anaerobic magnesium-protoporphyrin IX monomethyl ester cyclase